jgi:hypothetical protein
MADNEPKTFTIWTEGYSATGNESDARFRGEARGTDFNDAVRNYVATLAEDDKKYWSFNEQRRYWTMWGCRAFDNEGDARRAFS